MKNANSKNNHLRYGGYATILTLLVIAITLVVNVIVTDLNIKIDATAEKLYSVSDNTRKLVKNMDVPVHIYVLEKTSTVDPGLKQILTNYAALNDKLSVIYKDPILYPTFANAYQKNNSATITQGTIIVENVNTKKFRVITPNDYYSTKSDADTTVIESVNIENKVTNAIGYVCSDIDATVYYTIGHNEAELPQVLKDCFGRANLSLSEINLLNTSLDQPNGSILLVYSPHSDFSAEEITKITNFMDAGGRAMIFVDADAPTLPHFSELLNYYGISHIPGLVVETDPSRTASSNPTIFLPSLVKHDITASLNKSKKPVILAFSSGLEYESTPRNGVTITPLLSSSESSYLKKDLNATTVEMEEGDTPGPIALACAVEENNTLDATNPINTRLFVMADTFFLDENILTQSSLSLAATGNEELITNACGWLFSTDASYAISNKEIENFALRPVTGSELVMIGIITMAVIPLLIITAGIIVWTKRRHL